MAVRFMGVGFPPEMCAVASRSAIPGTSAWLAGLIGWPAPPTPTGDAARLGSRWLAEKGTIAAGDFLYKEDASNNHDPDAG